VNRTCKKCGETKPLEEFARAKECRDGRRGVWANGKGMPTATSLAIDRIDRSRGYELNNIRLLCNCVNNFRGVMSDDEMYGLLIQFYNYCFGRIAA
jgi:hypothetical protein